MFACMDLKFHKELKLFDFLQALLEKPFQTFYYSLKNSFEETRFQNANVNYFKIYVSFFLQRKYYTECYISNKVQNFQKVFENKILLSFIL
jgi:hypothetical protein